MRIIYVTDGTPRIAFEWMKVRLFEERGNRNDKT